MRYVLGAVFVVGGLFLAGALGVLAVLAEHVAQEGLRSLVLAIWEGWR